eukprot:TRINITY_DN1843_c0_g1_i3.p3 TRINITY_DN1843_c0_g1~~TRINITY_DN1843_c0_g1_i3.p3  ORF type:complete len:87 (-),score=15.75 TRINITY_DN1843_c0_g1_i3:184-444(-)
MLDRDSKRVAKDFFPILDMMLAIDPKTRYNLKECEKRLLDLMVATPVTPPEGLQITMNPPGESCSWDDPVIINCGTLRMDNGRKKS